MGDRQERELKLKKEIRDRLKDVCSNLSPAEFQELIDKIASNQLKGEYRPLRLDSPIRFDRTSGDLKGPPLPRRSA